MKYSMFVVYLVLLNVLNVQGQSVVDISQMERDMKVAQGPVQVTMIIELAEAYIAAGDHKKAGELAEEAERIAKKISATGLRAEAISLQGKIYLKANKSRRASSAFQESNNVMQAAGIINRDLILANLQELRNLAENNGKFQEAAKYDAQITKINNRLDIPSHSEAPLTRAEMREEIASLNEAINKIYSTGGRASGAGKSADARDRNQLMEERIADYEATIQKMNEDQVKNELMLASSRRILDSLRYQASLDAMNIKNLYLEQQREEGTRNLNYAIIGILFLLFGGSTFSFVRARQNAAVLKEKNLVIRAEQQRSENLLLNILPSLVAEELKKKGSTHARYFEDVSVLFADFVGFSKIAEKLSPQQLVTELDTCFKAFDQIMAKYGIEKIKTIGDAYMCAGGLPEGGGSQLRNMVLAAKEMQAWLHAWNIERDKQNLPRFDARIGIHRGPVVAGVVGSKKFAFDIWGDTVNIASRIEAAGEGGKINISGEVYEMIKPHFNCEYRGKIAAKNKGEIDMYFVEN